MEIRTSEKCCIFCFDVLFYHRISGFYLSAYIKSLTYDFLGLPAADKILLGIKASFLPNEARKEMLKVQNLMQMGAFLGDPTILRVAEVLKDAMQSTEGSDTRGMLLKDVVSDFKLD